MLKGQTKKERHEDYEGFVEKFKPKKTTDDCYTPPGVYEIVRDWVDENVCPLSGVEIVRPFWPGGNYEEFEYPEGCIVLDNPPFSILAKIRRFFNERGIRYFLFGPARTLFAAPMENETYIIIGQDVEYENGAKVPTGFITNMKPDTRVWVSGDLSARLDDFYKGLKRLSPQPAKFEFPAEVITSTRLGKIARRGINLQFPADECDFIRALDSMKEEGGRIFGHGYIVSERMAAEHMAAARMAAERMAAERMAAARMAERERKVWVLSEREQKIIEKLGKKS